MAMMKAGLAGVGVGALALATVMFVPPIAAQGPGGPPMFDRSAPGPPEAPGLRGPAPGGPGGHGPRHDGPAGDRTRTIPTSPVRAARQAFARSASPAWRRRACNASSAWCGRPMRNAPHSRNCGRPRPRHSTSCAPPARSRRRLRRPAASNWRRNGWKRGCRRSRSCGRHWKPSTSSCPTSRRSAGAWARAPMASAALGASAGTTVAARRAKAAGRIPTRPGANAGATTTASATGAASAGRALVGRAPAGRALVGDGYGPEPRRRDPERWGERWRDLDRADPRMAQRISRHARGSAAVR